RHAEFGDACSRAKAMRSLWWERKLGRSRKGAETTASIFALKNIDPSEWRDLKYTQHDHNVNVGTLTDAQLYAIASGRSAQEAPGARNLPGSSAAPMRFPGPAFRLRRS